MLCSDDLRWTPWTLYDTKNIIKQALVKFELWMMWMSDLLPILLVFRGWSMQHEHNEGLFWLPTKDNLTSEWLPKVCMCCHWPPKNHQKPAARQTQWNTKILAVLIVWTSRKWPERDLDTLRRLPPAEWSTWWPPKPRRSCNCFRLPQIDCKWRFHNFERRILRFPCSAWETHWIFPAKTLRSDLFCFICSLTHQGTQLNRQVMTFRMLCTLRSLRPHQASPFFGGIRSSLCLMLEQPNAWAALWKRLDIFTILAYIVATFCDYASILYHIYIYIYHIYRYIPYIYIYTPYYTVSSLDFWLVSGRPWPWWPWWPWLHGSVHGFSGMA